MIEFAGIPVRLGGRLLHAEEVNAKFVSLGAKESNSPVGAIRDLGPTIATGENVGRGNTKLKQIGSLLWTSNGIRDDGRDKVVGSRQVVGDAEPASTPRGPSSSFPFWQQAQPQPSMTIAVEQPKRYRPRWESPICTLLARTCLSHDIGCFVPRVPNVGLDV